MFSQNGVPVAPSFRDRVGRLFGRVEQAVVTSTRLLQPEPESAAVAVASVANLPVDPSDSIPEAGAEQAAEAPSPVPAKGAKATTSTPLDEPPATT